MDWSSLSQLFSPPPPEQYALPMAHDPWLVLLSFLIALIASITVLGMTERLASAEPLKQRVLWGSMGALCLSGGIWSMHFIAMLAMQVPVAVRYDMPTTLGSLLIALIAAGLAMYTLGQKALPLYRHVTAGLCVGFGVAAMHYSGMMSIRSDASQHYDAGIFGLSLVIAVIAALAALLIGVNPRPRNNLLWRLAASLLLATGIVTMHFSGMAALTLSLPVSQGAQVQPPSNALQLGLTIGAINLLITSLSLGAAWANRQLERKEHDLKRVNALVEQLDHARNSLQHAAVVDPLTGLFNRRGFNELFSAWVMERSAQSRGLAVMFLDIDHFKRINDTLGHDVGDELLKVVAQRMACALREGDVIARFGGDEFCILANAQDGEEARQLAWRIMQTMKKPVGLAGRSLSMTTSIGIALFPRDGEDTETLLKHADMALYQSKASGRNHFAFFSDQLRSKASMELELEEGLRAALHSGEGLELHFQPIVELPSRQVIRLEALLRWRHPQHGLLTPDRFIGIAEVNGFIGELDEWVIGHACSQLARLHRRGYRLGITVNCSSLSLGDERLPERVEQALVASNLQPHWLQLEITENSLMGNVNRAIGVLQEIRSLGVTIAIDDFGTGYSSLAYLRRLPLDTLKIDRSFVQELASREEDRQIVQAILAMANALRLQVVAEGVESEEQLSFLIAQGCQRAQGYLFAPALSLSELRDYLDDSADQPGTPLRQPAQ